MAKLIEGIPGRDLDPDFDIDENNACILSNDDKDDIDLIYDMDDYAVDESCSPVHVKVVLKDGSTVIVSMKKSELKAYTKAVNELLEDDDPDSPITPKEAKAFIEQAQASYTPAQSTGWKIFKVLIYIWVAAVIVGILIALFGK